MNKKENKKGRHSRVSLSGISLIGAVNQIRKQIPCFIKTEKTGDPRLQPSGMTTLFNNTISVILRGCCSESQPLFENNEVLNKNFSGRHSVKAFTLIELLVVVLIIGILAATALPQYQTAVDKSHATTYLNTLKAIKDAQEVFYLANGKYAEDFADLDVSLPNGTKTTDTPTQVVYDNGERYYFWVKAEEGTQSVKGHPKNLSGEIDLEYYLQHHTFWRDELPGSFILCAGKTTRGQKICKALGGVYYETHANGTTINYVVSF